MSNDFFEQLTSVCHNLLLNNDDLKGYLKDRRKMTDYTINTYKLGAFPKDIRDLYNKHNMDPTELRKQNIVVNANHSIYKMYPIVIPIKNVSGQSIAIGCRTLLTEEKRKELGMPKYRNSVYKKTSHLFGLNHATSAIRNLNKVFVVEGYFDCITAHQNGIFNVVATCGTMFSERQLIILSRYTDNVCLLFDNDVPGRTNAKRVIQKLQNFNENVRLSHSFTPDGYKDLDEYLQNGGSMKIFDQKADLTKSDINTLW
ncbi:MAG: toprim domain-containing protein [Patescibacteria group bacterium]